MAALWTKPVVWGPVASLLSDSGGGARWHEPSDKSDDQVIDLRAGGGPDDVVQVSRWFPATQESISLVRTWVGGMAASVGHADLASTLELLVSELATNAIQYTPAEQFLVELTSDQCVRVSVCDASPDLPRPRSAQATDTGGRGLAIVAGLADGWGAQPHGDGKCVWFRLDPLAPSPDRGG